MSFERPTIGRARVAFHFRGRPIAEIAGGDGTDETTGATPGAGATPAGDSQPTQTPQPTGATPPASTTQTPSSASDEEALGDPGKRALDRMKAERDDAITRARTAEQERDQLREAGQSEAEKERTRAVREAERSERAKWHVRIREAEVRGALRGAGIVNEKFLGLALAAPEFRELKVSDEGQVEGIAEAVDLFKKDYPEAFGTKPEPGPGGSWGGAEGGRNGKEPGTLEEAVQAHYSKH